MIPQNFLHAAITAEAIKYGGNDLHDALLDVYNDVYRTEISPRQWTLNFVVPLAKKADLSQMTNYRGTTLMSFATKLYNRLLLNRIRDAVDSHISDLIRQAFALEEVV